MILRKAITSSLLPFFLGSKKKQESPDEQIK